MILAELLDSKVDYEVTLKTDREFEAIADINGRFITVEIDVADPQTYGDNAWYLAFKESYDREAHSRRYNATGSGGELQVFSMVTSVVKQFIDEYMPNKILFDASKLYDGKKGVDWEDQPRETRGKLYSRMLKKFKIPGYKYSESETHTRYEFTIERDEG